MSMMPSAFPSRGAQWPKSQQHLSWLPAEHHGLPLKPHLLPLATQ